VSFAAESRLPLSDAEKAGAMISLTGMNKNMQVTKYSSRIFKG
jgi:hypothetical protein